MHQANPTDSLTKAFLNTGQALGMTRAELGQVVGRDRTSLTRGIDPDAKPGEYAWYRDLWCVYLVSVHRASSARTKNEHCVHGQHLRSDTRPAHDGSAAWGGYPTFCRAPPLYPDSHLSTSDFFICR